MKIQERLPVMRSNVIEYFVMCLYISFQKNCNNFIVKLKEKLPNAIVKQQKKTLILKRNRKIFSVI